MSNMQRLASMCKGGCYVEINPHKTFYETVESFLSDPQIAEDTSADERRSMIDADTVVHIQFYPHTPVGFYTVFAASLDDAVMRSLEIMREIGMNYETGQHEPPNWTIVALSVTAIALLWWVVLQ